MYWSYIIHTLAKIIDVATLCCLLQTLIICG